MDREAGGSSGISHLVIIFEEILQEVPGFFFIWTGSGNGNGSGIIRFSAISDRIRITDKESFLIPISFDMRKASKITEGIINSHKLTRNKLLHVIEDGSRRILILFEVKFALRFRTAVSFYQIQDLPEFRIIKIYRPVIVVEEMTERPVHQRLQKILLRHIVIHKHIRRK